MKTIISSLAIAALAATAVPAVAAPAAASLSVAKSVRSATPSKRSNGVVGENVGPIAAGVIAVGIAVGAVILITDKEDDSDSN